MKLRVKKGFSLVEVVVATAILAFALVGILGTYVACLVLKEATKHKCIEKLAEELIEKIESNFSDI